MVYYSIRSEDRGVVYTYRVDADGDYIMTTNEELELALIPVEQLQVTMGILKEDGWNKQSLRRCEK